MSMLQISTPIRRAHRSIPSFSVNMIVTLFYIGVMVVLAFGAHAVAPTADGSDATVVVAGP